MHVTTMNIFFILLDIIFFCIIKYSLNLVHFYMLKYIHLFIFKDLTTEEEGGVFNDGYIHTLCDSNMFIFFTVPHVTTPLPLEFKEFM
jgi:hypothetical protein